MITLKNISKIYNKGKSNAFQALSDVVLEIEDGELVAIVGTSGGIVNRPSMILADEPTGALDSKTSAEIMD